MLYIINGKCYVNIAPSMYVEVVISKDGNITPTKNKIEANANTRIEQTSLDIELKKLVQTEAPHSDANYEIRQKYNRRSKD